MVLAAVMIPAAGCSRDSETGPRHVTLHPRGIVLTLPDSITLARRDRLVIEERDSGFAVFAEASMHRRFPIVATVERHRDRDRPAEAASWTDERTIGHRRIAYGVVAAEGGSGGTQYELHAWEPCAGGYLEYEQVEISEWSSAPEFELAWLVIEGSGVPR